MKRITLTMMMLATTAAAVWAQVPPTPPAQPARPVPSPAPIARPARPIDLDEMRMRIEDMRLDRLDRLDLEPTRRALEEVRAHQLEITEASRLALEDMRFNQERALEAARIGVNALRDTPMPPMPALAPIAPLARPGMSDGLRIAYPQWFQGDPADSAYRFAHDVLSRGDYGRAAQLFRDIAAKYPKSQYQNDLPYYEAYARYKIGTTDELHTAAKLLEPRASKALSGMTPTQSGTRVEEVSPGVGRGAYREAPVTIYGRGYRGGSSDNDVVALYIRINSVLANRGDRPAADVIAKFSQAGVNTCDREDISIRAEALNAYSRMDPAGALPRIKSILEKKDECTAELRRRAVFLLGQRGDAEAATVLGVTAKSDPSVSVRIDAISWLPRLQGDAGVSLTEELLRTEQDERIQSAIIHTLVSSDNAKARTSMRALIERKDAPLNLRIEAINSYSNERATTEDAAYLRALYGRADNDRIKEAIVGALGRIGGAENDAFLLGIIKNTNEPSQVRSQAINRMMRSNIAIADLGKLYDAADARSIRQSIVNQLDRRQEPEAADKLYDIAKNSTDQQVKMSAFQALLRRKDERAKQLVAEMVDGKKPPL
jgi:TolA-binding protein/HEAT repeat protein